MLAVGRAMGKTMPWTMSFGNSTNFSWSLFGSRATRSQPMLANQFGESSRHSGVKPFSMRLILMLAHLHGEYSGAVALQKSSASAISLSTFQLGLIISIGLIFYLFRNPIPTEPELQIPHDLDDDPDPQAIKHFILA